MSATAFTTEANTIGVSRLQTRAATDRRLLDRLMFAMLLALLVLVTIPYGTVEPWWIALYECSVFGLAALSILTTFKNLGLKEAPSCWERRRPRLLALIAPTLAITAFIFLQSLTVSADTFETRLLFFKLLALAVNAVLLFRYTSNTSRLSAVVHTLVIIAVASAVFGIVRQAMQHNETGFGLPLLQRDSGFGQFINKNHFALLMEMVLGLATGLILAGGIKRHLMLIYGTAIALMWTALILTSSRGGLFTMLAQLVFVVVMSIWIRQRHASKRPFRFLIPAAALGFCLLVAVGVGALWLGGDLIVTRLESLSGEIRSEALEPHAGVRRREVWSASWQLFKTHPIAGSGFGAYAVAITKFHHASGKWTPEAVHNDYLELLASGGVLGTALFTWLAFVVVKRAWGQLTSEDKFRRAACLGALTGIFGVVAHNFVDFGIHVTANSVALVTLIVIATRNFQGETERREQLPNHTQNRRKL